MSTALTLSQAVKKEVQSTLSVSVSLAPEQMQLLDTLNHFAIHQAQYNLEVQQSPAKMIYKVNDELKMALVALLTTCALLDPKRRGAEYQKFFEDQIKIIQDTKGNKHIDFGTIRPHLVQQSIFPEIVNDWTLYRDINGDGIHALVDRKTYLQGLSTYSSGGHPVYEFARFYRRFMEDKIAKQQQKQSHQQDIFLKSLADQVIQQQLANGTSPQALLDNLTKGGILSATDTTPRPKQLPKK